MPPRIPFTKSKGAKERLPKRAHATSNPASSKREPQPMSAAERLDALSRALFIGAFVAIASVGFGVVALASAHMQVSSVTGNLRPVAIATKAISAGSAITNEIVTIAEVPATFVSEGSLPSVAELQGKTACVDIPANTQITTAMLSGLGNTSSLSAKLRPGMQAVTVSVSEDTGLSTLLRCGDKVHVYVLDDGGSFREIASSITIVALDGLLVGPEEPTKYSTVSLEVSADQATDIIVSEQNGHIVLSLNPLVS